MMTQGEIESLTIAMEKAASRLEMDIMKDIVRRIKANEGLTSTAEYQIDRLRQMGLADDYIKKEIMNELTLSVDSSTFGVHIKVSLFFLKEKMPYF